MTDIVIGLLVLNYTTLKLRRLSLVLCVSEGSDWLCSAATSTIRWSQVVQLEKFAATVVTNHEVVCCTNGWLLQGTFH